jgi:type II secretory ATPase GspE/PulE/Tfp pilus assembly ATPase PilB-like protein
VELGLACRNTGYKGRFGLYELLLITDEIRKLIYTRSTVAELFKVARTQGMTTLVQDGILKVLQGWTDYAQVRAVASK